MDKRHNLKSSAGGQNIYIVKHGFSGQNIAESISWKKYILKAVDTWR